MIPTSSRSSEPILAQARKSRLFKVSDLTLSLKRGISRSSETTLAQASPFSLKRESYSLDSPRMPLLAQARQLSLRREHSHSSEGPLAQARILQYSPVFHSPREGFMSPQTETKSSVGFKAGVKDYKLTYYTPDYETKDTDILEAFRVTPQPRVPPEEAGTAVAAESSTGTWTIVWTDGLPSLDRYQGQCYHIKPVAGEENQFIAYVAYP
ncbi:hypothetical protein Lal_00031487 [Lupinus albus]|nr:hypothetical protein Lal_00031487 [Lupinus albus]